MARDFDTATAPSTKDWRGWTPRERLINDAKNRLRVARSIRVERQSWSDRDNHDNGEAAVLDTAGRHRREAQASR